MINPNQKLEALSVKIRPLDSLPITIDFFNGEEYTTSYENTYPGYTPIVIGSISKDPNDENYIDEETWKSMVYDAYYDIDAYVNKAMTVLGMFHLKPNFSSIPVFVKDHMMRAIAAKVEQNLFTNPSNAEMRVTLTQNSGGRTTNIPGRENFNPSDLLNEKVREYINGSGIFELVADSFYAIQLDRNDYYTKDEIDALFTAGRVPVESLYTKDERYVPENGGDGVNKRYVDVGDKELQEQINSLVVGDPILKTDNVTAVNPNLESYTGFAVDQNEINIENAAITRITNEQVKALSKRIGSPLMGYKTRGQRINSDLSTIVDWDTEEQGTVDSLEGFDPATGLYLIQPASKGDLMSFDIQFLVSGNPLQNVSSGTAYLYKNGAPMLHPVTGAPIEAPIILPTTSQVQISLSANDLSIRDAGTDGDEVKVDDVFEIKIKQSVISASSGIDLLVSDFRWDFVYKRAVSEDILANTTDRVRVNNPAIESLSESAPNQAIINNENKTEIELQGSLIGGLQTQITSNDAEILDLQNTKADITYVDSQDDALQTQITSNDTDITNLQDNITTLQNEQTAQNNRLDGHDQDIINLQNADSNLQTQIDNIETNTAEAVADEVASLIINQLTPIGTIVMSPIQPDPGSRFTTWELVGELLDGQAIIGGTTTNGELLNHDHDLYTYNFQRTQGSSFTPYRISLETYNDGFESGATGTLAKTTLQSAQSDVVGEGVSVDFTGLDDKNRAYGLGVGLGVKLWRRIA